MMQFWLRKLKGKLSDPSTWGICRLLSLFLFLVRLGEFLLIPSVISLSFKKILDEDSHIKYIPPYSLFRIAQCKYNIVTHL